ncbi:hypothetical protein [Hugenholtzia roseola]|uniref:hypothetical protein n=1 Tax=Hugenholtzia roseola TaxID=1002 RepID=UPI000478B808|nr:hypothetical protein [Hugenholtzia roseola]
MLPFLILTTFLVIFVVFIIQIYRRFKALEEKPERNIALPRPAIERTQPTERAAPMRNFAPQEDFDLLPEEEEVEPVKLEVKLREWLKPFERPKPIVEDRKELPLRKQFAIEKMNDPHQYNSKSIPKNLNKDGSQEKVLKKVVKNLNKNKKSRRFKEYALPKNKSHNTRIFSNLDDAKRALIGSEVFNRKYF